MTQARRAAEMTEANYRLGAATQLDVIDAQQALRQAENIRNQALYSHANARATLQYVMGRDPLRIESTMGRTYAASMMHTHRWLDSRSVVAGAGAARVRRTGPRPNRRAAQTVRTVPVRTATVQTRDLTETLTLTGTLDPRARSDGGAGSRRRGSMRVLKNEGDRVAQGQLLAVLDDADFRLARDRAKASLDVAEANRAHARAEKERADSLLKTGGITDKDRLAAQVAVQVAEASASQARTELAIAERQLGAHADHGAAFRPHLQTLGRCGRDGRRGHADLSRSSTTRSSSSARRCRRAISARCGWARRSP